MSFASTPAYRVTVARRLRSYAANAGNATERDFATAILAQTHTPRVGTAMERLAELIDPTCEVEAIEPVTYGEFNQTIGYVFRLSCGHVVSRPYRDDPPAYCDTCGRRVHAR